MESAIFGLIGVIVGAALSAATDWWFDRQRQQKDIVYLSIRMVFLLDRFVAGCIEITWDDGLSNGSLDDEGCRTPQVDHPTFDPTTVDVEWKSLPPSLMYEILNFPLIVERSMSFIATVAEHDASAPDYEEYFNARILEFSGLGLQALTLAEALREISNLPETPEDEKGLSRRKLLAKAKQDARDSKAKLDDADQGMWEEIIRSEEKA